MTTRSEAISPTAHYTGFVWARNGLSHPELSTLEGRVLFESARPVLIVSQALGGASLEPYLLTRHRAIDVLLERAIEQEQVSQVIEVAAGLSPRGWRFTERYGTRLTYIEADLPDMAERKRRALERMGSLSESHRVRQIDALLDAGPHSLAALAGELNPGLGVAILTEGLLNYLPSGVVEGMWHRFASFLSGFAHGRYISDLHVGGGQSPQVRVFRAMLSGFVRGRVHLHFGDAAQAEQALMHAGFKSAEVQRAASLAPEMRGPGSGLVHVLAAATS
jgi:O-methyltransferase involved in polyketide biosynthesis